MLGSEGWSEVRLPKLSCSQFRARQRERDQEHHYSFKHWTRGAAYDSLCEMMNQEQISTALIYGWGRGQARREEGLSEPQC